MQQSSSDGLRGLTGSIQQLVALLAQNRVLDRRAASREHPLWAVKEDFRGGRKNVGRRQKREDSMQ